MTHSLSPPALTGWTARATFGDGLAFCASVFIVLTFSQFWVMPLTGPEGDAEASGLIRSLYFPAYAAALALAASQWRKSLSAALRTPLLWALIGMTFISTLWSVNGAVTERRAIAVAFTTLAGMAIAARYDWPRFMEVLATAFAILVALCFAFAIVIPGYGKMSALFPGSWRGVWYEKNALGANMTFAYIMFCAAAILNPKRAWLWIAMAALALVLVLLSTSKTSLVSLIIGTAALGFVILVKRGPATAVTTTFVAVAALIALGFTLYFASDLFFGLLGKDATLTGRTRLWAAVMVQIHNRPWTGFGYGAVWGDASLWGPLAWIGKQAQFFASHAHNSWLEMWLGMGYVGLVVWALLFVEVWMRTVGVVYGSAGGYFELPFLTVYSLMTLTESVTAAYNDFIWVMFAALAVKLTAPWRVAAPLAGGEDVAAPLP